MADDDAAARTAARVALASDLLRAQRSAEEELNKLYHSTIATVATGAIDRARDSAKFVQTAATAVFALYTGLLGLVFSVTDNPLPLRGIWAGVFLGLAVALATAYLAFLKRPAPLPLSLPGRSLTQLQHARTAYLTRWVNAAVNNRRWALRASVVSLAFGVGFVAAPFLSSGTRTPVPELPSPPAVPAAVAADIAPEAVRLFALEVDDYERAVEARRRALDAAASEAADLAGRERALDAVFALLAALALATVLAGPAVYARRAGDAVRR